MKKQMIKISFDNSDIKILSTLNKIIELILTEFIYDINNIQYENSFIQKFIIEILNRIYFDHLFAFFQKIKSKIIISSYFKIGNILISFCTSILNEYDKATSSTYEEYFTFKNFIVNKCKDCFNLDISLYSNIEETFLLYTNEMINKNADTLKHNQEEFTKQINPYLQKNRILDATYNPITIQEGQEDFERLLISANYHDSNGLGDSKADVNSIGYNSKVEHFEYVNKKDDIKKKMDKQDQFIDILEFIKETKEYVWTIIDEEIKHPTWFLRYFEDENFPKLSENISLTNVESILPTCITTYMTNIIEQIDILYGGMIEGIKDSLIIGEIFPISNLIIKVINLMIPIINTLTDKMNTEFSIDWVILGDLVFLKYRLTQYVTIYELRSKHKEVRLIMK